MNSSTYRPAGGSPAPDSPFITRAKEMAAASDRLASEAITQHQLDALLHSIQNPVINPPAPVEKPTELDVLNEAFHKVLHQINNEQKELYEEVQDAKQAVSTDIISALYGSDVCPALPPGALSKEAILDSLKAAANRCIEPGVTNGRFEYWVHPSLAGVIEAAIIAGLLLEDTPAKDLSPEGSVRAAPVKWYRLGEFFFDERGQFYPGNPAPESAARLIRAVERFEEYRIKVKALDEGFFVSHVLNATTSLRNESSCEAMRRIEFPSLEQ